MQVSDRNLPMAGAADEAGAEVHRLDGAHVAEPRQHRLRPHPVQLRDRRRLSKRRRLRLQDSETLGRSVAKKTS